MMAYKSPFHPFLPHRYSKYLFAGTAAATFSALAYRRGLFNQNADSKERRQNRIYLPIRFESELEPLLILERPLLANFTYRGDKKSDELTGALYRIVTDETECKVSLVDIEAEEEGVRDVLDRYNITSIPQVLALRSGLPIGRFRLDKDAEKVDWQELKKWIEEVADKD